MDRVSGQAGSALGTCTHPGDLHPQGPQLHHLLSPQGQGLGGGLQGWGGQVPTTLILIRAVAAVTDEVAELLGRTPAAVDNHGPTGEDGPSYGRDNGAEKTARIWTRCPWQVTEGTCVLQVTFIWAPRFGTLLGEVLSSQWHRPLALPLAWDPPPLP